MQSMTTLVASGRRARCAGGLDRRSGNGWAIAVPAYALLDAEAARLCPVVGPCISRVRLPLRCWRHPACVAAHTAAPSIPLGPGLGAKPQELLASSLPGQEAPCKRRRHCLRACTELGRCHSSGRFSGGQSVDRYPSRLVSIDPGWIFLLCLAVGVFLIYRLGAILRVAARTRVLRITDPAKLLGGVGICFSFLGCALAARAGWPLPASCLVVGVSAGLAHAWRNLRRWEVELNSGSPLSGFRSTRGGPITGAKFFWPLLGTVATFILSIVTRLHYVLAGSIMLLLGGAVGAAGCFTWLWARAKEKSRDAKLVIPLPAEPVK
jgi:hypothetical protein